MPTTECDEKEAALSDCNSACVSLTHEHLSGMSNDSSAAITSPTCPNLQDDETSKSLTLQAKEKSLKTTESIMFHIHKDGRHYVRCISCFSCPDIVRIYCRNGKLPAIVQENGTIFREETVNLHVQSTYHLKSQIAFRLKSIPKSQAMESSEMGQILITANEKLANKIGSLMIHVYHDAKKLTLSANSFPGRLVAGDIANAFQIMSNRQQDFVTRMNTFAQNLTCITMHKRENISFQGRQNFSTQNE
jgi:hypothetical protein